MSISYEKGKEYRFTYESTYGEFGIDQRHLPVEQAVHEFVHGKPEVQGFISCGATVEITDTRIIKGKIRISGTIK